VIFHLSFYPLQGMKANEEDITRAPHGVEGVIAFLAGKELSRLNEFLPFGPLPKSPLSGGFSLAPRLVVFFGPTPSGCQLSPASCWSIQVVWVPKIKAKILFDRVSYLGQSSYPFYNSLKIKESSGFHSEDLPLAQLLK